MHALFSRLSLLLLTGLTALTLSACGQKGALFIPEDPDAEAVEDAQRELKQEQRKRKDKSFFDDEETKEKLDEAPSKTNE